MFTSHAFSMLLWKAETARLFLDQISRQGEQYSRMLPGVSDGHVTALNSPKRVRFRRFVSQEAPLWALRKHTILGRLPGASSALQNQELWAARLRSRAV